MRAGEVIRCPTVEYLLEREIVQPEAGEVCFRARDMTTGGRVRLALWPTAPDAVVARGHARARILASLADPGIERLLQFGATIPGASAPSAPFVATEWVEGESLDARLSRGGLGAADAIRLGHAIGRALEQAHARGLVHGALGPRTVVLPLDGESARIVGFVSAATGLGGYAAPERASASLDALDPGLDLYALGAILFRVVAGRPPHENRDPKATAPMQSARGASLASLAPGAPEPLGALVDALLAEDPSARPRSASEVVARLAPLLPGGRASQPPRSSAAHATMVARPSGAPSSRVRSSRGAAPTSAAIPIVGAAFGVLGVAGVIALVVLRSSKTSAPVGSAVTTDTPPTHSALPSPSASAAPTSSARIMASVPLPVASAPAVRFACGMSFFCSADKEYCLAADDRETTFSCVKAPKCEKRPECDCITVPYESCERIEGGLMVRRAKRPSDDRPDP